MVMVEGVFVACLLVLGRNAWGYCYSTEDEVVKYVAQMMLLLAFSHIVDGIQSVLSGNDCDFIIHIFIILFPYNNNDFFDIYQAKFY